MFTMFYRIYDKFQRKITAFAIFTDGEEGYKPSNFDYDYFETKLHYEYFSYKILEQDEEELKTNLEDYDEDENDEVTGEDLIRALVKSRKMLPNASYFAFTATPKNKTLELFGVPYQDGEKTKHKAFHLYSMKQAIEEGFIMDVLQNYSTYQSYYALLKKIEDDPEYDKNRAQKKLKAYVESNEHAIKKKTILMVEHFMENIIRKKRMGGLAKAMLVTSSRANAVKYKTAFVDCTQNFRQIYN